MQHKVSLERVCYTQFHEKPILQTDIWGKSVLHCLTERPCCTTINVKPTLHIVSWKAYSVH